MAPTRLTRFRDFYPYYLSEHRHRLCRVLHYLGSTGVLILVAVALTTGQWLWLLAAPVTGYGFAWIGHGFVEHNRPATFTYPLFSLAGDWVMFYECLTGRLGRRLAKLNIHT